MAAICDTPIKVNIEADQTKTQVAFITWTEATARTFSCHPRTSPGILKETYFEECAYRAEAWIGVSIWIVKMRQSTVLTSA